MNALLKSITGMGKNTQDQAEKEYDYRDSPHLESTRSLVDQTFAVRDDKGNVISVPQVISARELSESRIVAWIDSYKALLKYVSKDYRHIFEPKTTGNRSGTRYYVPLENVVKFLVMFEDNQLNNKL